MLALMIKKNSNLFIFNTRDFQLDIELTNQLKCFKIEDLFQMNLLRHKIVGIETLKGQMKRQSIPRKLLHHRAMNNVH